MAFEDPGHVVKEFGGGSDMGHPNEEPVVLDCIECLHAVQGPLQYSAGVPGVRE